MESTSIIKPLIVVLSLVILLPFPGAAQYSPGLEPGYELVPLAEDDLTFSASPHPDVLQAQDVAGVKLLGIIELKPGMQRYFEFSYPAGMDGPQIVEYEVVSTRPHSNLDVVPVSYSFPEGSVLLALGISDSAEIHFEALSLHSFWVNPDGTLEYLQEVRTGGLYGQGVFILDLIGDGVLEVLLPWATGVASGGGIDILAVVPTGGLAFFGTGEEYENSIYSVWGSINPVDYDGDGDWELEVFYPVLYPASMYYGSELLSFDWNAWDWQPCGSDCPDYYDEQLYFYSDLYRNVVEFIEQPAEFLLEDEVQTGQYGCIIGGRVVTLDPFFIESSGEPDTEAVFQLRYAVELLKSYLE